MLGGALDPASTTFLSANGSVIGMLEETAAIAQRLIQFDTSNYGEGVSNGETDAAEYVGSLLESLGLGVKYFDSEPGRTSVIAQVEGEHSDRPGLVVHGHLDVVPADPANWSVDPFAGEIRDGMLWGRGAVDMKNMDAMMIGALTDILGSGRLPARNLTIAFFADEENGESSAPTISSTIIRSCSLAQQKRSARWAAIRSH